MLQIKFLSNQEVAGGLRRFSAEAEPLQNPHKNTPSGHNFRADPHKNRNQNPHKNFWSVPEPKMPNPYITSAQELAAYIRSPDDEPKRRPIWGVPGLHIIKKDSRWSYLFEHQGRRYHGTLGTYPKVQLKEAKATYQRKRFAITDGLVSKPRRTQRKKKADDLHLQSFSARLFLAKIQRYPNAVFPLSSGTASIPGKQQSSNKGCGSHGGTV